MGQCKSGVVLIATCYLNKLKKKIMKILYLQYSSNLILISA